MDEDDKERLNRKLIELLNELRVALPGVQVLFAFLLAVPFSTGFTGITGLQRNVYFFAFVCAALSSALLIAPSAYHRVRFRGIEIEDPSEKAAMLISSRRLAVAGLAFLALSMTAVVFLISDVLFGSTPASVGAAALALVFGWFWYGLPLLDRIRGRGASEGRTRRR